MRLTPAEFWALSLPEWRALWAARFPMRPACGKADLERLMKENPDV